MTSIVKRTASSASEKTMDSTRCNDSEAGARSGTMELTDSRTAPLRLLQVGAWDSLADAQDHALVVVAMGMDCSIHPMAGGGYEILTAEEDAPVAKQELALYAAEQSEAPRRADHVDSRDHPLGIPWWMGWAVILAATYLRQMEDPALIGRFSNSSRALMEHGDWWRPFTALFLHADPLHLLGNILIGGMFCLLVTKSIGAWRGWLLVLLGGTIGNAINAALHPNEAFSSIGASTSTFAALGILVGLAVADGLRQGSYQSVRTLSMPLLAGLILFSWFGISGENTDIGGHGWGALCGLVLGATAGWLRFGNAPSNHRHPTAALGRSATARASWLG